MKHYGIYRGIVANTNDPEGRSRLKAQVPIILGKAETDWAWPCVDSPGTTGTAEAHTHSMPVVVPSPGTGVWIMFEAGDIEKPVWLGVWL